MLCPLYCFINAFLSNALTPIYKLVGTYKFKINCGVVMVWTEQCAETVSFPSLDALEV